MAQRAERASTWRTQELRPSRFHGRRRYDVVGQVVDEIFWIVLRSEGVGQTTALTRNPWKAQRSGADDLSLHLVHSPAERADDRPAIRHLEQSVEDGAG